MKKFKIIFILSILFYTMLLAARVFAASESQNYQLDFDQIDYGGSSSESEKYNINSESLGGELVNDSVVNVIAPEATNQSSPKGLIQSLSLSNIANTSSQIIDNFINSPVIKTIVESPGVSNSSVAVAVTTVALAGVGATLPIAANLPVSVNMLFSLSSHAFSSFPIFGKRKKRKYWGKVYDSESKLPIEKAIVRIYNGEERKLLETQITDSSGMFNFIVNKGNYFIEAIKNPYVFPSKILKYDYRGGIINVGDEPPKDLNIPLDPPLAKVTKRINILWNLKKTLEYLYYPLLFVGAILAVLIYIKSNSYNNYLVVSLYFVVFINELYKSSKSRPYGLIFNKIDKAPINYAIVRLFEKNGNRLISTKVSDSKGRFTFMVEKGQYYISATKEEFAQYNSKEIMVSNNNFADINIAMEKANLTGS